IFDNGAAPKVKRQSRALVISLDTERMRATLVRQYTHPQRLLARALGSAQLQANGDMLVGWGTEPYLTEFAADGTIRFDAKLPDGSQNYRSLRFPWVGRPTEPPRLVARSTAAGPTVYASWNGATEVAAWQLHWDPRPGDLRATPT